MIPVYQAVKLVKYLRIPLRLEKRKKPRCSEEEKDFSKNGTLFYRVEMWLVGILLELTWKNYQLLSKVNSEKSCGIISYLFLFPLSHIISFTVSPVLLAHKFSISLSSNILLSVPFDSLLFMISFPFLLLPII